MNKVIVTSQSQDKTDKGECNLLTPSRDIFSCSDPISHILLWFTVLFNILTENSYVSCSGGWMGYGWSVAPPTLPVCFSVTPDLSLSVCQSPNWGWAALFRFHRRMRVTIKLDLTFGLRTKKTHAWRNRRGVLWSDSPLTSPCSATLL